MLSTYRHHIWDWIVISVFKVDITNCPWISPQITSKNRKLAFDFFLMNFVFWKNLFSNLLLQKMTFDIWKTPFWIHVVISKFQWLHFCFYEPISFKSFSYVLCHLTFFSWIKISFWMSKNTCLIFFDKPRPLQKPPEAKLLISVVSVRDKKN